MAPETLTAPVAAPALAVTIFTKNGCAICDRTKATFDDKGVPYIAINVEEDLEPREEFGGLTPFEHVVSKFGRSMPAVVVADDLGYEDTWTGGRMDKWIETVNRFSDAGLLIPEAERVKR